MFWGLTDPGRGKLGRGEGEGYGDLVKDIERRGLEA